MTAPIAAARTGGVSFRLAGVPVTIHVTFLLIITLFGVGLGEPVLLLVWVPVAGASVLLHEMGHALVGRLNGMTPRVDLAGLGGMTSWGDATGQRSRLWNLAISAAGPGIEIAAGLVAIGLGAPCCGVIVDQGMGTFAASAWVYVCLAWGLLNLLPILPLDGGHVLESLLPGDLGVRRRRAAAFSVGVGVVLALGALTAGLAFGALLAGWLTWNNIKVLQAHRALASESVQLQRQAHALLADGRRDEAVEVATRAVQADGPPVVRASALSLLVHLLVEVGRTDEAFRLATDPRPGVEADESAVGRAIAAHADRTAAERELADLQVGEVDPRTRGILVLAAAFRGDFMTADLLLDEGPVSKQVEVTLGRLRDLT